MTSSVEGMAKNIKFFQESVDGLHNVTSTVTELHGRVEKWERLSPHSSISSIRLVKKKFTESPWKGLRMTGHLKNVLIRHPQLSVQVLHHLGSIRFTKAIASCKWERRIHATVGRWNESMSRLVGWVPCWHRSIRLRRKRHG